MSQVSSAVQDKIEGQIRLGGGLNAVEKQHRKGRLTARERIEWLMDPGSEFFELGLWAAWGMYAEWGGAPGAGLVCGVGKVAGRRHMIIANDATVKAGSFFPMTVKKLLRAQHIAMAARLPLIYLVDSAGVFLPLQDEVFPDQDDFGRIFRNNAVISAAGIPQTAAIMGPCVAGGAYLPVMCDRILMTEGSGLYIAGPSLVKAAIGQEIASEELGGARLHASLSGTVDFRERDDTSCLVRLRRLAEASCRGAASRRSPVAEAAPGVPDWEDNKPYRLQRRRVGEVQAAFVCTQSGFGSQFDPLQTRRFLCEAAGNREPVVVMCRVEQLCVQDAPALAMLAFECLQAGAVVLLAMDSWQDATVRHWSRSVAPALVVTPFAEGSIAAASGLWTDVLYPAALQPLVLEEAVALLQENL